MELSERGKLQKANLDGVLNYGANFLEILLTGDEVLGQAGGHRQVFGLTELPQTCHRIIDKQ